MRLIPASSRGPRARGTRTFSRRVGAGIALLVVLGVLTAARPAVAGPNLVLPPNIVVVMTDDQTVESMTTMTRTQALLAKAGTTFSRAFVNDPHCCPSRATYLTGRYAHNHGIFGISSSNGFSALDTWSWLPRWLQEAGYRTVHVGKVLTGYGRPDLSEDLPGFDEWYALRDPTVYRYYGYSLNENGVARTYGADLDPASYQTDVLTARALSAVRRLAPSSRPFFLNVAYMAPHAGLPNTSDDPEGQSTPDPAPRHRDRFSGVPSPQPPSVNEADTSDKPSYIRDAPALGPIRLAQIRENYQQRLESLLAVDEGVARIVQALTDAGELDNTLIVFTSDNGFMHGEHRRPYGKLVPYEPSIRVPLILRGPGVPSGQVRGQLVTNADLTPTILEAAGGRERSWLDGLSLFGFLRDPRVQSGRPLLIESLRIDAGADGLPAAYAGLRMAGFTYVEYDTGEKELYDLARDPHQLTSRHGDPAYEARMATFAGWLRVLRTCGGATCRSQPGATPAAQADRAGPRAHRTPFDPQLVSDWTAATAVAPRSLKGVATEFPTIG